jgi:hypothetical protein
VNDLTKWLFNDNKIEILIDLFPQMWQEQIFYMTDMDFDGSVERKGLSASKRKFI